MNVHSKRVCLENRIRTQFCIDNARSLFEMLSKRWKIMRTIQEYKSLNNCAAEESVLAKLCTPNIVHPCIISLSTLFSPKHNN